MEVNVKEGSILCCRLGAELRQCCFSHGRQLTPQAYTRLAG